MVFSVGTMNTKLLAIIAIVAVAGAGVGVILLADNEAEWPEDDAKYKEVEVTAFMYTTDKEDKSTVTFRYYEETPNVPFISLKEYYKKLQGENLTAYHEGDGIFTLNNHKKGAMDATLDVNKGTITAGDYTKFSYISDVNNHEKGVNFPLIQSVSGVYLEEAKTATIDLTEYGIKIHTDKDSKNIWVPFQTAADLFINGANYYAFTMGDAVFFIDQTAVMDDDIQFFAKDPQFTQRMHTALVSTTRSADLIEYTYNELCLLFDTFYGKPGLGEISELQAKYGLDKALDMYGDNTRTIKEYLKSPEWAKYLAGLNLFSNFVYDGGHTVTYLWIISINQLTYYADMAKFVEDYKAYLGAVDVPSHPARSDTTEILRQLRTDAWSDMEKIGDDTYYYEKGDTAVFVFDSFNDDAEAWTDYMNGDRDDLPDDCIGDLYRALDKANSNPNIEKFVLDLTTNGGGYVRDVVFMNTLLTTQNHIHETIDTVSREVGKYEMRGDINLDGKFDDDDYVAPYRFDYAILTSCASFSSGNLLPVTAQYNGIMILGERSGGGSCNMQIFATADGMTGSISGSSKSIIGYEDEDYNENTVEMGAIPDATLVIVNPDGTVDYSGMYDIETISEEMEKFYAEA